MDITILTVIIIGLVGLVGFLLWREKNNKGDSGILLMQNQLQELRQTLDAKLGDSTKMFQQQFGESSKIIQDVTERLTRLDETNKQVVNFADQLQSLQDILKNPKQRGILGEYYLETLLKNVMPEGSYKMQYAFQDGTIVDAVLFVKEKIIPIDSKFSIENYNRFVKEKDPIQRERFEKAFKGDLKNRIDETSKYVKPGEGTLEFAFMFVPHEAIYLDLLERDLIEYAFGQKKVIIVSPTNFLAYLQTVLQGLRALTIEESAKEIRARVEQLSRHLLSYEQYMNKLGNHLGTTVGAYNSASKEFVKIDKDVLKITGASNSPEPLTLDRPQQE